MVSACSILSYWHRLLMWLQLRQCHHGPAGHCGAAAPSACSTLSYFQPRCLCSPCGLGFARRFQSISARTFAVVSACSILSYWPRLLMRLQLRPCHHATAGHCGAAAPSACSTLSYFQPRCLRSPCGPGFSRRFQNISARAFAVVSACSILSYWNRLLTRLRLRQCHHATAGHCGPPPPPPPLLCAAPHSAYQAQSGARSECGGTQKRPGPSRGNSHARRAGTRRRQSAR